MKSTFILICLFGLMWNCDQNPTKMNKDHPSLDLEYWSGIMKSNPANAQINSLSFEDKYKIIEYAYNKIGLSSNYTYAQLSDKLEHESFLSDELFNEENQINRLAYWIVGLWGSMMNLPQNSEEKFNYVKLSNQIWFYDGEQDDIDYQSYVNILHKMRKAENSFSNWNEFFDKPSNVFKMDFEYNNSKRHWDIINESGGWLNGIIFKYYTDLCEQEYIEEGNYFMVMEGQGGYIMFLSYEAEEYLRTLWDFPKLNKQGKMMSLNDYGKLYVYDKK